MLYPLTCKFFSRCLSERGDMACMDCDLYFGAPIGVECWNLGRSSPPVCPCDRRNRGRSWDYPSLLSRCPLEQIRFVGRGGIASRLSISGTWQKRVAPLGSGRLAAIISLDYDMAVRIRGLAHRFYKQFGVGFC